MPPSVRGQLLDDGASEVIHMSGKCPTRRIEHDLLALGRFLVRPTDGSRGPIDCVQILDRNGRTGAANGDLLTEHASMKTSRDFPTG